MSKGSKRRWPVCCKCRRPVYGNLTRRVGKIDKPICWKCDKKEDRQ